MNQEELAMQLIIHAGNAKSKAMAAIAFARAGEGASSDEAMAEHIEAMTLAHQSQSKILQQSLQEPGDSVGMLMAHAQDHIMGAIAAGEFAREICALHDRIDRLEEECRKNTTERNVER